MLSQIIEFRQKLTSLTEEFSNRENQNDYRKYLANFRGLPENIIQETRCFYVYDKYFFYNIDKDLLEQAGFTNEGENVYRESFVFPVYDTLGLVAGFIGYDADRPHVKYLVSKTKYFHKQLGYGSEYIQQAYKKNYIILTEGIFDTLAMRALGFYNTKSMLGIIPFDYIKYLCKRFKLVIWIPDGDEMGQNALKNLYNLGQNNLSIILPSEYKDANEIYRNNYGDSLKEIIKESLTEFNNSLSYNKKKKLEL